MSEARAASASLYAAREPVVMAKVGKPRGLIDLCTLTDAPLERAGNPPAPVWKRAGHLRDALHGARGMSGKPSTGGKVLAILLGAFGVIVAANMAMLVAATGTDDVKLALAAEGGTYAAPLALEPGRWRVAVEATDGAGARYEAEADLRVRGAD